MRLLRHISSIYFLTFFISLIILFLSKIKSPNIFIITLIIFILIASSLIYFLIKKNENKLSYFIVHFTIILSIYLFNFFLIITEKTDFQIFLEKGVKWDTRTKIEYINQLQQKLNTKSVYPVASIQGLVTSNFLSNYIDEEDLVKIVNNNEIYPVSNISESTIVFHNEIGTYYTFESDKYGFNNPKNIIEDINGINITLLGDSFTEGCCVPKGSDIGNKLRKKGFNVNNLGRSSSGIVHHNIVYREYSIPNKDFKSDYVIMLIYFLNDLNDTYDESNSKIYRKYIDDVSFTQNLIKRQKESDSFLFNYFELLMDPNFRKKYPILKIYGQDVDAKKTEEKNIYRELNLKNIKEFMKLEKFKIWISKFLVRYDYKSKVFFKQIEMINDEIAQNSNFFIVCLPSYYELKNKTNYYSKYTTNKLNELNIQNITMYDEFSNYDLEQIFYYGLPGHYSEKGYEIIAEYIKKFINN